jgi:hypothetical protein
VGNHARRTLVTQAATLDAGHDHADGAGIDFAALVGNDGWWRLAPDIRRRFGEHPTATRPIRYAGVMHTVRCSTPGWLIAQVARLIGTPFATFGGAEIPVAIRLRHGGARAVVWEREYRRAAGTETVVSTKRLGDDGALHECVGGGFGMRLAVFEAGGALHFLSLRYFWSVGSFTLWLPALLTPGTTHVIHEDLGDGRFRFRMTIKHRWLGMLFEQDGVFARDGAVS